jgi:hypothetical protein
MFAAKREPTRPGFPPDRKDTDQMTTARLQTQRLERFVGMPAKPSNVSAALPMSARSCYVSFTGVSPIQGGHKWDRYPVGANLS